MPSPRVCTLCADAARQHTVTVCRRSASAHHRFSTNCLARTTRSWEVSDPNLSRPAPSRTSTLPATLRIVFACCRVLGGCFGGCPPYASPCFSLFSKYRLRPDTRNTHSLFLRGTEFDGPYPGCGLVQKGQGKLLHPSETVLVDFSQAVGIGLRFQVQKLTVFKTIYGKFLVKADHHASSAAGLRFPAAKPKDPTTDSKIDN